MTEVKETFGRALEEARQMFAIDSILNFILGILVAYVVIYFITFYLGPVLFGYRPYYRPWPIVARTMHHVTRRAADFDMDGDSGSQLTARVTSAVQDIKDFE